MNNVCTNFSRKTLLLQTSKKSFVHLKKWRIPSLFHNILQNVTRLPFSLFGYASICLYLFIYLFSFAHKTFSHIKYLTFRIFILTILYSASASHGPCKNNTKHQFIEMLYEIINLISIP